MMATEKKGRKPTKVLKYEKKEQKIVESPKFVLNGGPAQPTSDTEKHGMRHLIECTCILPQYLKSDNPVFHKFIVFSIVLENDAVKQKYAQCNFCGIIHNIIGICRSEIVRGKEDPHSVVSKEDIAISFPHRLAALLEDYKCELHVWEHVKFILDEEKWGDHVVLTKEVIDGRQSGKFIAIGGQERFAISPYSEAVQYGTTE